MKTKFSYTDWHYTRLNEDLFELTKDQLNWYRLIYREGNTNVMS